jgi:hypothetical protein
MMVIFIRSNRKTKLLTLQNIKPVIAPMREGRATTNASSGLKYDRIKMFCRTATDRNQRRSPNYAIIDAPCGNVRHGIVRRNP